MATHNKNLDSSLSKDLHQTSSLKEKSLRQKLEKEIRSREMAEANLQEMANLVREKDEKLEDALEQADMIRSAQEDNAAGLAQALDEVAFSRQEADKANNAKSQFLASMSHEIRTPMNAILGMAELLAETSLDDEQKKYVSIFKSAGETLLDLINDILDLSKVESGQIVLEKVPFDLRELLDSIGEIMAIRAFEKRVALIFDLSPNVPCAFVGDPSRLRQILINLASNSIKFTERGEVVVTVENTEKDGVQSLLFSVSDTGIGIAKENQGTIFETFCQADSSTTRKYGGTGLGLSISKKLVELMGGQIWLKSALGSGSTFFFTLEVQAQADNENASDLFLESLKGVRTVLMIKNRRERAVLHEALQEWGALVRDVDSCDEAHAEIETMACGDSPYTHLLIEYHGEDQDILQMVKNLTCMDAMAGLTIILLSSDHSNTARALAKDSGAKNYLLKPIKLSELLLAIRGDKGESGKNIQEKSSQREAEFPELKVLLVEDSQHNRMLIEAFLKKTPCVIDFAENGAIAVEKFQRERYDVVLMDMQMPVMDGYTATSEIRKWEKMKHASPTPVIALTAHALTGDAQKSVDAGCSAHLTKPIRKSLLLETILKYAKGEGTSIQESPSQKKTVVTVDPELEDLIPVFFENLQGDIKKMRACLEKGDFEKVMIFGHSIKGAGGGYGFDRITEIGKCIEFGAKEKDEKEVERGISELFDYLSQVAVVFGEE